MMHELARTPGHICFGRAIAVAEFGVLLAVDGLARSVLVHQFEASWLWPVRKKNWFAVGGKYEVWIPERQEQPGGKSYWGSFRHAHPQPDVLAHSEVGNQIPAVVRQVKDDTVGVSVGPVSDFAFMDLFKHRLRAAGVTRSFDVGDTITLKVAEQDRERGVTVAEYLG